jgi:hypothetical protein
MIRSETENEMPTKVIASGPGYPDLMMARPGISIHSDRSGPGLEASPSGAALVQRSGVRAAGLLRAARVESS